MQCPSLPGFFRLVLMAQETPTPFPSAALPLPSASVLLLLLAASPSSHTHCWPLCLMEWLARKRLLIFLLLSSPDSLFPLDIGAVKKDHSFLDQDSLKSLCR